MPKRYAPVGHGREAIKRLLADRRTSTLTLVAFGWLLVLGTRLVVPSLLPQVKAEFSIGNTSAGFAITLIWFTYAMVQFPAGAFTDRWGERRLLLVSVLASAISVGVFVISPLFVLFLIACVLFGLGSGLFAPPRITLLSRIYPERDSTAIGITLAAGSIGAAVLPFAAGLLGVRYGWRNGFGALIPLFLIVFVGLWWNIPSRSPDGSHAIDHSLHHALGRVVSSLRNSSVLLTGSAITLVVFTYQGFTSFFPTYLVMTKGIQQDTATILFAVFFATGAVVQPLAGRAADQVGDRPLFLSISAVTTITLALLPFVEGILSLGVLAVFLGVRAGLGPVNNAYLVAILPDDVQGASYGLIRTVYLGIGATGSVVVGLFADAHLFDEAFLILASLTAIAFALYLFLPPRSSL